jgi:hypothetical protein
MAKDDARRAAARQLLREHGTTYAQEAGVRLRDAPSPLYRLLVLAALSSAPIQAEIAVSGARALFEAGYRTPRAMRKASWQDRVDALGRGHYRRYDESMATALGEGAEVILDRWGGDLRSLRPSSRDDLPALRRELMRVPRIAEVGSGIFCREVQGVWTAIRPFFDAPALRGARGIGLPDDADELAHLVRPADLPRLAAALVRVSRTRSHSIPRDTASSGATRS